MKLTTTMSLLVGVATLASLSLTSEAHAYTRLTPPPPAVASDHSNGATSVAVAPVGSGQKRPAGINDPGPLPDVDEPSYPVPEPETMALTSFGLLALGLFARKRQPRSTQDSQLAA